MKISVFGSGYVGLVTGACFAEMGNTVICADIDQQKIDLLNQGQSPIHEPGLSELIVQNHLAKRLKFTTNLAQAVEESDYLFIAVGTPSDQDGSADLGHVLAVAQIIGASMKNYKIIVNKSTVPIGTYQKVKDVIQKQLTDRDQKLEFDVVSNPEFLKEGAAIIDFLKPDRVVLGIEQARAQQAMQMLYEPFLKNGHSIIVMDILSAEMTKYAANAMLATRISFMNELAQLCEKTGADIEAVRRGISADPRIGSQFIYPGLGYGGSCFPKDIRALIKTAEENQVSFSITQAVQQVNLAQQENFYFKIENFFKKNLTNKKIALWGLAFKAGTNDVREAPSLSLIQRLTHAGATVIAYDPVAIQSAQIVLRENKNVFFNEDQYLTLQGADALCVVTEWSSFREPDFQKIRSFLKKPVIFDGRNLFNLDRMKALGFCYISIGRKLIQVD